MTEFYSSAVARKNVS